MGKAALALPTMPQQKHELTRSPFATCVPQTHTNTHKKQTQRLGAERAFVSSDVAASSFLGARVRQRLSLLPGVILVESKDAFGGPEAVR